MHLYHKNCEASLERCWVLITDCHRNANACTRITLRNICYQKKIKWMPKLHTPSGSANKAPYKFQWRHCSQVKCATVNITFCFWCCSRWPEQWPELQRRSVLQLEEQSIWLGELKSSLWDLFTQKETPSKESFTLRKKPLYYPNRDLQISWQGLQTVQRPCFHGPACQDEPAALQTLVHQSVLAPDSTNPYLDQEKHTRDLACLGKRQKWGGKRRTKYNQCILTPAKN